MIVSSRFRQLPCPDALPIKNSPFHFRPWGRLGTHRCCKDDGDNGDGDSDSNGDDGGGGG